MGEKKQRGRFTIQFNMEDPQQRAASEFLEQQGRHKAQFIASAVLFYTQCPKPLGHGGDPPAIDEATLERMLLHIMDKHPRFAGVVPGELSGAEDPPSAKVAWEDSMGGDALKAISDTLAAFQQR